MSEFLRACRREPTAYTPIWLMRQAGRYQPEYRAIREKVGFVELCKTPDLAAEVTLLPITQLGVDAAIIFADILLVLEPLDIGFEFTEDEGPRIPKPIRSGADVDAIRERIDAEAQLGFVAESIRAVRVGLPSGVPLIGFAGAPFTLASYVIEGGSSREYLHTKGLMTNEPGAWDTLMNRLTDAVIAYLRLQVEAGAQALQIFDSWIGCLGPDDYVEYVQPYMTRLFNSLPREIPVIHFGTGNPALYRHMKDAGGDVIGLDFRVDLGTQWDALQEVAVMGNLDPAALLAPREEMKRRAKQILQRAGGRAGHIFNLGHGVLPGASVETVRALVDFVHEQSAR
jgi:uroporphyrinogen decarboxylase